METGREVAISYTISKDVASVGRGPVARKPVLAACELALITMINQPTSALWTTRVLSRQRATVRHAATLQVKAVQFWAQTGQP
jgi:hypothetical protein